MDRFVEREIQSLLVHCIHQEEGCDWKDELRKREVINKLPYDVRISHDVYPLPALLARAVPDELMCSRETLKSAHSSGKKKNYRTPCHESTKIALEDFSSCLEAIDSIMVLNRPLIFNSHL